MASTTEERGTRPLADTVRHLVVNRDVADELLPLLARMGHPGCDLSEEERRAQIREVLGAEAVEKMSDGSSSFHLAIRNDREPPRVVVDPVPSQGESGWDTPREFSWVPASSTC